ncbi:MAG: phage terminase large subunit [Rhodospirillaceae bacterium]|nr:MAG: phage terminase large subunit [Rhodospirillaceae bacterium]
MRLVKHPLWMPASWAQIEALLSKADVLGYGGAAGGGKTDLLLGLAVTRHQRALICRREAVQVKGLEDRAREIIGTAGRYNGQDKVWRLHNGRRMTEFGSVREAHDWRKYQGRPYDLIAFDEAANFLETQVRALMGWNRTTVPDQRCRVVMAFNPPTSADGFWIIDYFGPWLDRRHPDPAKPGDLRWYVTGPDGKDMAVPGPEPVEVNGEWRKPKSRTFVPARVEDNPYLMATDYMSTLDALPEPLRSMLRHGDMTAGQDDDVWQVIPTAWVEAAQKRWTPERPRGVPMSALGVDVARGGRDSTVLVPRYGHWYGQLVVVPGTATPDGPAVAGLAVAHVRDGAPIQVDVIGVGSSVYDHLRGARLQVAGIHGAESAQGRDRSGRLEFANRRTELWWKVREALDPATGSNLALPPDRALLADLCAPRWTLRASRIQVETKEDIIKRLGRSPDRGDAVVYALPDYRQPPGPVFAKHEFNPFKRS